MAVCVILTVFVLNTSTSEGVGLPNYIPILQVNPGGRTDIIESLFRLGLYYTEILLHLVSISWNHLQLQTAQKNLENKGLGRNPSDLREVFPDPVSKDPTETRQKVTKKSPKKSTKKSRQQKLDIKLDTNVDMTAEKSKGNHGTYQAPYLNLETSVLTF